jgi:hypothetical protein
MAINEPSDNLLLAEVLRAANGRQRGFKRIPDSKKGGPGYARQIVGIVGSVLQHGLSSVWVRGAPIPVYDKVSTMKPPRTIESSEQPPAVSLTAPWDR